MTYSVRFSHPDPDAMPYEWPSGIVGLYQAQTIARAAHEHVPQRTVWIERSDGRRITVGTDDNGHMIPQWEGIEETTQ